MAQIDPLSVAALEDNGRMSERTKTVLAMWASFDDPVTAVVTPIILMLMAAKLSINLASGNAGQEVAMDLAPFVAALLLVGGIALWNRLRPGVANRLHRTAHRKHVKTGSFGALMLASISGRIPSLAALLGWFVRPQWLTAKRLETLTRLALFGAVFLFGMVLADGVNLYEGVLLGVFTYLSQIVAAWLVVPIASRLLRKESRQGRRLNVREIWHLALAQMSGITAIVIALNLEMFIDGAVATIAMVIIVVNILHPCVNAIFDKIERRLFA